MVRLEYIMLLKLPIILSGNSFIIHLLFPKIVIPKYSWSNSWNCKSQIDIFLELKIQPLASIKTIPKDRDTLIEQSQLNLSDCSIRVSDCSIRVSRSFCLILC